MLKNWASDFYYDKITGRSYNFITIVQMVKTHFKTKENRQLYILEWRETIYQQIINTNLKKSRLKCLQILFNKLQKIQHRLSAEYQREYSLRD